jgi:hypothetical protein
MSHKLKLIIEPQWSKLSNKTQEVGGTLIGEDGFVVMAGAEKYQIHGYHNYELCSPNNFKWY